MFSFELGTTQTKVKSVNSGANLFPKFMVTRFIHTYFVDRLHKSRAEIYRSRNVHFNALTLYLSLQIIL